MKIELKLDDGAVSGPGTTRANKTGAWRTFKPVYDDDKCIRCALCELYCPEGCVEKKDDGSEKGIYRPDYDFCKGCGICANECPKDAITMVLEEK